MLRLNDINALEAGFLLLNLEDAGYLVFYQRIIYNFKLGFEQKICSVLLA